MVGVVARGIEHFAVGVLYLGCGAEIHRSGVGLVFGDELAQAVVDLLGLVHYVAAAGGVIAGVEERSPRCVMGGGDPQDRVVHAGAQRCDRIRRQSAEHIIGIGVGGAVAIGL